LEVGFYYKLSFFVTAGQHGIMEFKCFVFWLCVFQLAKALAICLPEIKVFCIPVCSHPG